MVIRMSYGVIIMDVYNLMDLSDVSGCIYVLYHIHCLLVVMLHVYD